MTTEEKLRQYEREVSEHVKLLVTRVDLMEKRMSRLEHRVLMSLGSGGERKSDRETVGLPTG